MRLPIADSGGRNVFGELTEMHDSPGKRTVYAKAPTPSKKKVVYATAPGEDDKKDEDEEVDDDAFGDEEDDFEDDEESDDEPAAEDDEAEVEDEDDEDEDDEEEPEPEPDPKHAHGHEHTHEAPPKKRVVVKKKRRMVYATEAKTGSFCKPGKQKSQKYKRTIEAQRLDRAHARILREADRGTFEEVPLDPFAAAVSLFREATGEIHSAKAHRCVEKVMAKGHSESSAWAICTTSIGKGGTYAKGHGGSARPKRKIHE